MIRSRCHHQGLTLLRDWRRQLVAAGPVNVRYRRALKDVEARILEMEENFRVIGWTPTVGGGFAILGNAQ